MINWLKSLFSSPKKIIKMSVDALDVAVPYLASEFDKLKGQFSSMSSTEQAQLAIDRIQAYLVKTFHLDV